MSTLPRAYGTHAKRRAVLPCRCLLDLQRLLMITLVFHVYMQATA